MSLADEIGRLKQQRLEHERAITVIDDELQRAVEAIGGKRVPAYEPRPKPEREIRASGSLPNEVFAALAASEPRTVEDVWAYTGKTRYSKLTVQNTLRLMAVAGTLHRTTLHKQGNPSIYARTREAIDAFVAGGQQPAPASDDELGIAQTSSVASDEASTSLEAAGTQ